MIPKIAKRSRSKTIITLIGLFLIIAGFSSAEASDLESKPGEQPTWLYKEAVKFVDHHDQAAIVLAGKDRIYLDGTVYYEGLDPSNTPLRNDQSITFESASEWVEGTDLFIAYSSTTGAVLLDPVSGKFTEILSGLREHPLDKIHEEKEAEGSTASVVIAANEIIELWKLEIDRIYDRLRLEYPEHIEVFDQAQAQWKAHVQADLKARRVAFDKEGSIYLISAANAAVQLYRNHALRLATWGRF